jgi:hypothetical protein
VAPALPRPDFERRAGAPAPHRGGDGRLGAPGGPRPTDARASARSDSTRRRPAHAICARVATIDTQTLGSFELIISDSTVDRSIRSIGATTMGHVKRWENETSLVFV